MATQLRPVSPGSPTPPGEVGQHSLAEGEDLDGPELTKAQESAIKIVLEREYHSDFARSDATKLQSKLSKELEELDQANIVAILESERQVDAVMDALQSAIDELDKVDDRIDGYWQELSPLQREVEGVAELEGNIDTRYDNEKRLVAEVNSVVNQLEFPASWQFDMKEGDLANPRVVRNCVKGVLTLREKNRCIINPDILHPALSTMDAMQTSKQMCLELKNKLSDRFVQFFMSRVGTLTDEQRAGRMTAAARRDELLSYKVLTSWLHEIEEESAISMFASACETYGAATNRLLRTKTAAACDVCTAALPPSSGKGGSSSSSKGKGPAHFDLDTRLKFDLAVEAMLFDLIPYYIEEYLLANEMFLSGAAKAADDGADGGGPAHASSDDVFATASPSYKQVLLAIFSGVDAQIKQVLDTAIKVDPFMSVSLLVRLEKKVDNIPPEYRALKGLLASGCTVHAKRAFDTFIRGWVDRTAEFKTPKSKKFGILGFVDEFATLVEHMERHLKVAGITGRHKFDTALMQLADVVESTIERIASECKHHDVVLFENFHRLNHHYKLLKVECLKEKMETAHAKYKENLNTHVNTTLDQPLPLLNEFFQGVERHIQNGTPEAEVHYNMNYNKDKLRKTIANYPRKEIKKALESTYKRVDKVVSEGENLRAVVWQYIQDAFITQFKGYEDLLRRCYPGSDITLPLSVADLLADFNAIARAHAP